MEIKQIYTGCLAQGAYYIESKGEVAIIDPLREVQDYIDEAAKNEAKIKYIFETHFHADFVSGHVTLSEKTGAPIIYGPNANPKFDCIIAEDEQIFELGDVKIKVLHTPGHTMESVSYLLIDENGKDHALFSGDTLFLGDVGRPDLAQKAASMTQEELAGTLFDSLRTKIMTLADDVIVYPGHGAGSACGKNMSKETVGSIGDQKATNYALRADMTKEEFIKEVTDGLATPPAYFPLNVQMNKEGYQDVEEVINRGKTAIKVEDLENIVENTGALVLDVRHQNDFGKAHIPKSIFIGIDGGFAPWVGALIKDVKQPMVLVVDPARLEETITRLSRVGFDNILGYVDGGVEAWAAAGFATDSVEGITAQTFDEILKAGDVMVKDVRKNSEYLSEHVLDAANTPLDNLNDYLGEFEGGTHYIHCAGGYRSMIAASILKSRGIHNIIDVQGGFAAIKEAGVEVSEFVCPSTL
ncbi:Glyoxylase, beta-lactamase superfamily II [Lishizhenia tianjinensis]|uniref:Glyoxylase, beta-lactamase superfamily II n=1 Tax=Lishizhenia tianjinensis TaxID=477690 RepID=A0A1I6YPT1_9FLAO|nr:rhodanese-like domain-containing protein [Lishizhenia tianjinensis]SFT52447.1 Glyoxylase, beta-lactamase superfamily II [Lishizhenia tianjinensis]